MWTRSWWLAFLIALTAIGTGCAGDDAAPAISEEHREYASGFCDAVSRLYGSEAAISENVEAFENAGRLDTRRLLATNLFTRFLEIAQRFGRDVESLTPPVGDEAFQAGYLQFATVSVDYLEAAIPQLASVDTHEELGDVVRGDLDRVRVPGPGGSTSLGEATDELRGAIESVPTCEPRFFGLREF